MVITKKKKTHFICFFSTKMKKPTLNSACLGTMLVASYIMTLIEVIKWQILDRAKGFNWSNPWKIGHWSPQKIKWGVIWEGSLIYEWHACIIHCRIGYVEATRFVNLIIIKEDIIGCITSFFHKFIMIRSLFGLNDLQTYNNWKKAVKKSLIEF